MATQGFVIRTLVPDVTPFDLSFPNTRNLSTSVYRFIKMTTTSLFVATDGISSHGDRTLGVAQDQTDGSTKAAVLTVRVAGVTKVILGADCGIGMLVKCDANGAAIEALSGDVAEGYLLSGGLSGEAVAMVIQHTTA